MRRFRYARFTMAVAALAVFFGAMVFWYSHARRRSLLDISTRLVSISEDKAFDANYSWWSDHELLLTRSNARLASNQGIFSTQYTLLLRDIHTGADRELTAVSAQFNKHQAVDWDLSVAYDSQWLLFTTPRNTVYATTADGSQHWEAPVIHRTDPVDWTVDSHSIIETVTDSQNTPFRAVIRSRDAPHKAITIPLQPVAAFAPHSEQLDYVIETAPGHWRMQVSDWALGQPAKQLRIARYEAGTTLKQTGVVTMPAPPPHVQVESSAFDGPGERVAWLFSADEIPPLARLLSRFFPGQAARAKPTYSLWAANADGTDMREIGYMDAADDGEGNFPKPDNLAFSPDGKHVTYAYKGVLYAAPLH